MLQKTGIHMDTHTERNTMLMYANIGKLITSSLDIQDIVKGVMSEIKQFFDPENWSLLRLDHTTNELYFIFMEGAELNKLEEFRLKPGEGIAGTVASTGKSIFSEDVSKDPRFSGRVDSLIEFKTQSIIAVPLVYRDEVYGVIEIVNSDKTRNFSQKEHDILATIADFTAIAMANSTLYHKVIEQSCHDILTGLLNRNKLNELIEEWKNVEHPVRRTSDTASEIMVVYMDVDNFKEINDRCGHSEGDRALIGISDMLEDVFRTEDLVFRIGGDEFLAVIKSFSKEDSENLISRIENSLKNLKYRSEKADVVSTVSYGISKGYIHEIERLIDHADSLKYREKIRTGE